MTNKFYSSRSGPFPVTGYPGPTGVGGPVNKNLPYANPTASVPGPLATENRGYWTGPEVPVAWARNGSELSPNNPNLGLLPRYEATYETPIFDLRPDLRASASAENQAAYPIWRGGAFGAGGSLQIMVRRTDGGNIFDINYMEVWWQEFAALSDPTDFRAITPSNLNSGIEVTSQFYQGAEACLLNFVPPSNPVRYWKGRLYFKIVSAPPLPVLFAQGVNQ
jgi:hypothetical protein